MIEKPEKVFPCDCMSEGLIVHTFFDGMEDEDSDHPNAVVVTRNPEMEDKYNHYTIDIGFWGFGPYSDGRLSWYNRLRLIWYIIKHGHPWSDMVCLTLPTAKNLANNILYKLEQIQKKVDMEKDELTNKNKPPVQQKESNE